MIDHAVSMAVAVQSHKGIYALLLGSGVSRAAGIPTGWEVIGDLIRRVAVAQSEDAGDAPDEWFRGKFGKEPSYSDMLQLLAPNPAERTALLKGFFEPTQEEREQGLKLPTEGNKAIARLVAAGHIRVIVTTNFDCLTERAIEAEGVSPTIVATADQVEGMMPLPHVQCLVVKVHGDYLDTRLRNTPTELSEYPDAINGLLDSIFSEYGLIICGWSGDWDVALVDAITRNTRFRFSTYWMAQGGKLSNAAKDLVARRQGIIVPVEDANKAFTELAARVEALDQQRLVDPASPRIALAMAKRFLSSDRHRIDFHDLVMRELQEVRRKTDLDAMPLGTPEPDEQSYPHRVHQIAAACSVLAPVVATGVRWDNGMHDDLWRRCVTTLARSDSHSGSSYGAWSRLQYAPATIIAYSACAAALITGRLNVFKVVLIDAQTTQYSHEPRPAVENVGVGRAFQRAAAQFLHGPDSRLRTPGADWMVRTLAAMLDDVLPPDVDFEDLYDELELIVSLVSADVAGWAMPGRFMWRKEGWRGHGSLVKRISEELDQLGDEADRHTLLAAGLFGGQANRLRAALQSVAKVADEVSLR